MYSKVDNTVENNILNTCKTFQFSEKNKLKA
jgi:hypothetical protein